MQDVNRGWYCDDSFWKEFHEYIFDEQKELNARIEVDSIIELTGVRSGSLLDMPCGPGRHSVIFAGYGFKVTGVDINNRLLDLASERARRNKCVIDLIQADMRNLELEDEFDLAINMFTSLGYYNDYQEDLKVVRNIRNSLKSGGIAFFEMSGREVLKRNFRPLIVERGKSGVRVEKNIESSLDWKKVRNTWVLYYPGGKQTRCCFEQTIYSADELQALLNDAGFTKVEIFGSIAGDSYDDGAKRLIAIAVRN